MKPNAANDEADAADESLACLHQASAVHAQKQSFLRQPTNQLNDGNLASHRHHLHVTQACNASLMRRNEVAIKTPRLTWVLKGLHN